MPIFSMTLYCDYIICTCVYLLAYNLLEVKNYDRCLTQYSFQWKFHELSQTVSPHPIVNLSQWSLVHTVSILHQNKVILTSHCYWSNWNNGFKVI